LTANIIKKCKIFNVQQPKDIDLKTVFVIVISGIMVAFSAAFIPMERNDGGAIIRSYDPYFDLFDR
jgi:hypothetical protein